MKRRLILFYALSAVTSVKLLSSGQTEFAQADALKLSMGPSLLMPTETGSNNVSIDLNKQLTPHFKLSEFACHCGGHFKGCQLAIPDQALILAKKLEIVRSHFYPSGLNIVSSYRCPEQNKAVGGVGDSQHTYGKAADISPVVNHSDITKLNLFTGVGWNRSDNKVVHVDVRSGNPQSPATWTYPLHN